MTNISIRPATEDDHPTLWQLLRRTDAEEDVFLLHELSSTSSSDLENWLTVSDQTFVATADDQIIGAYALRPHYSGRGNHVATGTYVIDVPFRGRGFGRQLGQHSIEMARALGYRAMQFDAVVSSNQASLFLWYSLGFHIVGAVPQGFRHPTFGFVDLYIMHRFL